VNSGRKLQEQLSSNSITTFFAGQYQPPTEKDFSSLIKDLIDDKKETLIKSLKDTGDTYFENVHDIRAEEKVSRSIWFSINPKDGIHGGVVAGIIVVPAVALLLFVLRRK